MSKVLRQKSMVCLEFLFFTGNVLFNICSGFWVCDKAGKMRELKSGMPQLDPCCFPLLHPRGTLGFRWFMKKNGIRPELTDEEKRMQEELDEANQLEGEEILDETADPNPLPMPMDDENNMDEEENELDQDAPSNSESGDAVINSLPKAMNSATAAIDDDIMNETQTNLDQDVATSSGVTSVPINPLPKVVDTETVDGDEVNTNDEEQQLDSDEIDVVAPNDNVLDPDAQHHKQSTDGSKSNISERQFYRYRMAMRANKKGTFQWLWYFYSFLQLLMKL